MALWSAAVSVKTAVYYGSYLVFPFLFWLLYALYRRPKVISRWFYLALCALFIWSRFVEPQMIRVRETHLQGTGIKATIVLIADLHLGAYKSPAFLARVVEKINLLPIERVLIAGDFIGDIERSAADEASFSSMFSALSEINAPVFAVLGNHDASSAHSALQKNLRLALEKQGVQLIEKKIIDLEAYRIAGLEDRWEGDDSPTFILQSPSEKPTLVLAHQPDSALQFRTENAALLLAGHTHCGQIRISWLYRRFVPSNLDFYCGLGEVSTAHTPTKALPTLRVFITPGLGEIALPLRFLAPPTIDYIHLHP